MSTWWISAENRGQLSVPGGHTPLKPEDPLYLGSCSARLAQDRLDDLFDHQIDVATVALVLDDPDVFQAHQGLEDLVRVSEDEGALCFLGHT